MDQKNTRRHLGEISPGIRVLRLIYTYECSRAWTLSYIVLSFQSNEFEAKNINFRLVMTQSILFLQNSIIFVKAMR